LHEGWKENWRVLAPTADRRTDLSRRGGMRAAVDELRELPEGTLVAIFAPGFGAVHRVRKCARRAEIVHWREYMAFPSVQAPAYLVEASPTSLDYFFDTVATVPPNVAKLESAANLGLTVLRAACRSSLLRRLFPGRILVGSRS
jgi:hypothetical protein